MKKYFYMLMAVMALSLVACKDKNELSDADKTSSSTPGDNGGNGDISGTGVKNEFGDGRLIIGYWTTGGHYPEYFTFRSDGTCKYHYSSIDSEGYWSYDPDTKTLASTMGVIGSMKINIMTPQALQGTTTGGRNYGLEHYKENYVLDDINLIIGKWKTQEGKELIFDKNNNYIKDGTIKGKYSISGEPGRWTPLTLRFDNKVYMLRHLSGGFLYIITEPEYGATETEFAGEYYYVSE